ncbi:MAG: hypothetical protein ACJ780_31190 [Solirubrobacteraceae bacterium]
MRGGPGSSGSDDVRPQDAALLDDVPDNVEGARAIGMHGVTFLETGQAIADLEALIRPRAR